MWLGEVILLIFAASWLASQKCVSRTILRILFWDWKITNKQQNKKIVITKRFFLYSTCICIVCILASLYPLSTLAVLVGQTRLKKRYIEVLDSRMFYVTIANKVVSEGVRSASKGGEMNPLDRARVELKLLWCVFTKAEKSKISKNSNKLVEGAVQVSQLDSRYGVKEMLVWIPRTKLISVHNCTPEMKVPATTSDRFIRTENYRTIKVSLPFFPAFFPSVCLRDSHFNCSLTPVVGSIFEVIIFGFYNNKKTKHKKEMSRTNDFPALWFSLCNGIT